MKKIFTSGTMLLSILVLVAFFAFSAISQPKVAKAEESCLNQALSTYMDNYSWFLTTGMTIEAAAKRAMEILQFDLWLCTNQSN